MNKLFEEFRLACKMSDTCGMARVSAAPGLSGKTRDTCDMGKARGASDTCGTGVVWSGAVLGVMHEASGASDTCGMGDMQGGYGARNLRSELTTCDSANNVMFRAKNRFVRAATCESLATDDGRAAPELLAVYRELARGGVGTIITGFANISPDDKPAPCMMGIYNDSFIEEWQPLTQLARECDTRIVLQVVYGGSASRTAVHPLGPSAVANPKTGVVPREATPGELRAIVSAFAAAARRARAAGFDGVEIHAAHGYLLSQFLSPLLNGRNDEYGGSVENRTRLTVEVIEACRGEVGDDFPLFVKVNSSDGVAGGLTCADSLLASAAFAAAGASAIEVSGNWHACNVEDFAGHPFFEDYAVQLARRIDVPVILTGGNRDLVTMSQLAENGIAAFGLCRPLICEPDLPNRWHASLAELGDLSGSAAACDAAVGPAYAAGLGAETRSARAAVPDATTGSMHTVGLDAQVVREVLAPHCTSCTKCYKTPGHRCVHTLR